MVMMDVIYEREMGGEGKRAHGEYAGRRLDRAIGSVAFSYTHTSIIRSIYGAVTYILPLPVVNHTQLAVLQQQQHPPPSPPNYPSALSEDSNELRIKPN
jgi:hypothetical protein